MPPNEAPETTFYPLLRGQTAIVTGASKGLGRAIAIALAKSGADVAINYYSDEKGARETLAEVETAGRNGIVIAGDVSNENAVHELFAQTIDTFGRLDICVPNSGIQISGPSADMDAAAWRRVIDVNLTGQFLCAKEAIRIFLEQEIDRLISTARGKIVMMSSVHDLIPWEGHANYASAKGGIMLLMKSLAQEYAARRIRVNAVSPGAIRTPMNVDKIQSEEVFRNTLLRLIPYGRIGEPEDVGQAVVWLASDASDYVTGTTIYIDGGMTLYPGFIGGG